MDDNRRIRVAPAQASTGALTDHRGRKWGKSPQALPSASLEGGKTVAKWQQWMPFRIGAFKSSPAVQAMHSSARSGYLYLLACCWQTEDCTIPSDPILLAEMSGMGDELWALHGPRILRKFHEVDGTDRLRNDVCHQEWLDAKAVFDRRRASAERTNSARSPHQSETVTERTPSRSADTRTTVVLVPVDVPDSVDIRCLSETVGIFDVKQQSDMLRLLTVFVKESGRPVQDAIQWMIHRWQQYQQECAGHEWQYGSSYKFFMSGKWNTPATWAQGKNSIPNPGATQTTISEDEAYLRWQSMSEAFKAANPWR